MQWSTIERHSGNKPFCCIWALIMSEWLCSCREFIIKFKKLIFDDRYKNYTPRSQHCSKLYPPPPQLYMYILPFSPFDMYVIYVCIYVYLHILSSKYLPMFMRVCQSGATAEPSKDRWKAPVSGMTSGSTTTISTRKRKIRKPLRKLCR